MEEGEVLIIGDCRDTAYLLTGMFAAAGLVTEHAETKAQAAAKLRQKRYRFLLVDIDGPAGDLGLMELAREVLPEADIVLTVNNLSEAVTHRAREAGVSLLLPKPLTVEAVLDLTDRWGNAPAAEIPPTPTRRERSDWLWVCPVCKTRYQGWSPLRICSECGYRE